MKILFYFVHPAKYHLFKNAINLLKINNEVDIIINSKDVLEKLIKDEKWNYVNIFPKGRNNSKKPSILKSGLKFLLTIIRLEKYLLIRKRYNVFITDDSLVVNGFLHGIKSYLFNDNDISTIKINKILFYFASNIIAPESTDLGKFIIKKVSFKGNKALAHLHPNYYKPNQDTVLRHNYSIKKYIIIRLSKLNATHDISGNTGIVDSDLENLIKLINKRFDIIILAERSIDKKYQHLKYIGNPNEIYDFISYAKLVISDSGTVATESAILGTPNILINKLSKNIGVHQELFQFGLQYYFDNLNESYDVIQKVLETENLENMWQDNKIKYLENCDDLNKLLIKCCLKYR